MNSIKNCIFCFSIFAFVLIACNPERGCINRLDGTWTLNSTQHWINGALQDTATNPKVSTTFTFSKFNTSKEESGLVQVYSEYIQTVDSTMGLNDSTWTLVADWDYQLFKECTEWSWSQTDSTNNEDITANILELSKDRFAYSYEISDALSNSHLYEIVLEK